MSSYTTAQIRAAILRAADHIERNPQSYDFVRSDTPSTDCGTTACMWGWIGYFLGMPAHSLNAQVATACGIGSPGSCNTRHLYSFCKSCRVDVPNELRRYADKYFPAEAAKPVVAEDRQLVSWSQCPWQPNRVRA